MTTDYTKHSAILSELFAQISVLPHLSATKLQQLLRKYKKPDGALWSKDELLAAYRQLGAADPQYDHEKISRVLRKRPVRTQSGVAPITVLTKPFPCPGKCIFCPSDVRMPKSYLADEPGAQRAERNYFDPYLQVYNRLTALLANGHMIEKAEIIVLGGTWSYYPEAYQVWFIAECFRALNEFQKHDGRDAVLQHYRSMEQELAHKQQHAPSDDPEKNRASLAKRVIVGDELTASYNQVISEVYVAPERLGGFDRYQQASWETLLEQQLSNETAQTRCVGLVVETRPDNISPEEVRRIRRLGCTKAQIGIQSLQDSVLEKNHRGHDVAATRRAIRLLRLAGFKIHAHWMANLYGSSVEQDKADFDLLFSDPDFCPDELKIYPCSLIGSAELMSYFNSGKWHPYTKDELSEVLTHCILATPEYCRLTRIIRDIPSTDIVEGNKITNFRQLAENSIHQAGKKSRDIRAREIKALDYDPEAIHLTTTEYQVRVGTEVFFQALVPVETPQKTQEEKLLGFLRLLMPSESSYIEELHGAALIREVHVYGQAQGLGTRSSGKTQHKGLGTQLMNVAIAYAKKRGFQKIAVISAVGTREYYRKLGFSDGELYQHYSVSA